jgi:hypothetical protein
MPGVTDHADLAKPTVPEVLPLFVARRLGNPPPTGA